jgi:hypothetical protein
MIHFIKKSKNLHEKNIDIAKAASGKHERKAALKAIKDDFIEKFLKKN